MAKAVKKTAKKAPAKKATAGKKTKRAPLGGKKTSFKTYIGRLLKQTSKDKKLTMSKQAAAVLDSFANHMLDTLAEQAAQVARAGKVQTLGPREIQAAVKLTLQSDLAKHAMAEGTKAVARASA